MEYLRFWNITASGVRHVWPRVSTELPKGKAPQGEGTRAGGEPKSVGDAACGAEGQRKTRVRQAAG